MPLITNKDWIVNLKTKKRNFIMSLFRKNKELYDIKERLDQCEWKYDGLKYEYEKIQGEIKKVRLISNIYPNESIHPMSTDYKKDRERLESTGYTMQGCVDNYEIWVNKGVKNG